MKRVGALSMEQIQDLVTAEFVKGAIKDNLRCGSLDHSITGEVYRVRGSFLPRPDETVLQSVRRLGGNRLQGEKILLERGCCYVLPICERIESLPEGVYSYCNPKSSSGRVDLHVRLLADYTSRYDSMKKGYSGALWLLVVPRTFPVIVSPGLTLNQSRFFNQDTRFDEFELQINFNSSGGLLYNSSGFPVRYEDIEHSDKDGSILLSLGLNYSFPGFEATPYGEPIDLSLRNHYDPKRFFDLVRVVDDSITLSSDTFYILSSDEHVRVPEHLACEMASMDERSGDVRSHYAGYIDAGWGVGEDGKSKGRPLTLEVRSFDTSFIVRHGQPIAKIRFERMCRVPELHYDQMSPTYGLQDGPKLGKQFAEWK